MSTAKKRAGASKSKTATATKKTSTAPKKQSAGVKRASASATVKSTPSTKKKSPGRAKRSETRTPPKRPKSSAKPSAPSGASKRHATRVSSAELLAIAAISDAERAVFEAQFTLEECDIAGARTRAPNVLAEAIAAVEQMGSTVLVGALRYGTNRLRFLIDLLGELNERVAYDRAQRTEGSHTRGELEAAMLLASDTREEMQHVLGLMARGSTRALDELDRARAQEDLSVSLRLLATSAEHWLSRSDTTARALVAAHTLSQADIDSAHRAARRLEKALTAARAGVAPARDLPETNRIEGRVLKELSVLHQAVNRARVNNKLVPALKLGPTLRRELAEQVITPKVIDEGPRPSVPPTPGTQ